MASAGTRPRGYEAIVSGLARAGGALMMGLVAALAGAQDIGKGAVVRVQVPDFGAAWHEGTIGRSPNGCTMVYLRAKAAGNYDSVALAGVARMQALRDGAWTDVAVKPRLAQEPKACRDGQND